MHDATEGVPQTSRTTTKMSHIVFIAALALRE